MWPGCVLPKPNDIVEVPAGSLEKMNFDQLLALANDLGLVLDVTPDPVQGAEELRARIRGAAL